MRYQIDYEKGIVNRGNLFRMKELMKKAANGEKLVLGFLGGSITQGCLSSTPETCYAYHVFEWWKKQFPEAEFEYVNAGIGGTTSQFGVARAQSDLLSYKPDFVIVEFSVNDDSTEHFMETYEGLVRKIYDSETKPAMLLVHNVCYDTGANAQLMHARVGRYYDLPSVSMQSTIYEEVKAGRLPNREITQDDLHPNDAGHSLVASVITYFLSKVFDVMDEAELPAPELRAPFTYNDYEDSVRYDNRNSRPELNGFAADTSRQEGITDCFKNGWSASKVGDSIRFELRGGSIAVQYRKTINKPAPVAEVVIDGDTEHAYRLDANFDETWGDKLELETVAEHLENKLHTVDIRIVEATEKDQNGFDLISVIVSGSHKAKKTSGELIFLDPALTHNIWGGSKLRTEYGYPVEGDDIGECWGISAHPNGDGVIREGAFKGMHLSELWAKNPELFGNPTEDRFPLLIKIIDAKADLSIQVHPDDEYALKNENGSLGKTECWYVLDCPENASLVIGHNASTREELKEMIEQKRWSELIREIPIKKGDFIQIDPGTVHAIKGGFQILETQQNSDITYRVYDYDRLSNGKPRELHVQKSIDVITVPAKPVGESVRSVNGLPLNRLNLLYSCNYYSVFKLEVSGKTQVEQKYPFLLMTVVSGQGSVNGHLLKKGDHFIAPADCRSLDFEGNMQIIASTR